MLFLVDAPLRENFPLLPRLRGEPVRIVSVGNLQRFLNGREGAYCRLVNGTKCEAADSEGRGGRPYGSFFIDQMSDPTEAARVAESIVDCDVEIVDVRPFGIITSRGPISIQPITFLDGGKHPRMDDGPIQEIINEFLNAMDYNVGD